MTYGGPILVSNRHSARNDLEARTARPKRDVLGYVVIGGAVAAVMAAFVFGGANQAVRPDAGVHRSAVQARTVLFRDDPSGGVAVFDEAAAKPFAVLDREKNSFLATSARLARQERERLGYDADAPFVITRWSDGRVTVRDTALNRETELSAFGPTNAATFAALLPDRKAP
jgi:putative photosynthetic complex assembly protein